MKFLRRCLEGTPLRVSTDMCIDAGVRKISFDPEGSSSAAAPALPHYTLPLVRLDINVDGAAESSAAHEQIKKKGITSALAGLTNQPAGDKICTMQVRCAF